MSVCVTHRLLYFPAYQGGFNTVGLFGPFSGPWQYLLGFLITGILIVLFTSGIYFALHRFFLHLQNGEDLDDESPEDRAYEPGSSRRIQLCLILFACITGIVAYLMSRSAFHSIRVDPMGNWMELFRDPSSPLIPLADSFLALGIMGIVWGWTRFFQILLIDDIFTRYSRLVGTIPLYSASLILAFSLACWYFYSNIFPFYWYLFSFGLIYGFIYYFSLKDFKGRIRMHLNRTVDFEEHFSLKTISVVAGVILTVGIGIPHAIYGTLPAGYIAALFVGLWVVSMYMTPGRVFRHIKIFPRYSSTSARMLNFARYTRKYLFVWFVILSIFSFILGAGIIFDPGFSNPGKNLTVTNGHLEALGRTMHQYMEQNTNFLPSRTAWLDGSWIRKVKNPAVEEVPPCPFNQRWVYHKWRDENHRPVFEIRVLGAAHRRGGAGEGYPRYHRFLGLVKSQEEFSARSAQEELNNPDDNK